VVVAALLEADEIVGTHIGYQRKLLPPKGRCTPAAKTREADVFRGDPLAPRAQELAELLCVPPQWFRSHLRCLWRRRRCAHDLHGQPLLEPPAARNGG
jgi:hypothetical protein